MLLGETLTGLKFTANIHNFKGGDTEITVIMRYNARSTRRSNSVLLSF